MNLEGSKITFSPNGRESIVLKPNYLLIQKSLKDRFGLDDPRYNKAFEILADERKSGNMKIERQNS